jgi:hypothetical protein
MKPLKGFTLPTVNKVAGSGGPLRGVTFVAILQMGSLKPLEVSKNKGFEFLENFPVPSGELK